jgi:acetyl esterase/lipase
MSSRHLIDPELLPGLEILPGFAFSESVLPMVREQMTAMRLTLVQPEVEGIKSTECKITGGDGHEIGLFIYTPMSGAIVRPAVLYIHGGGYVIGNAEMMRPANQLMAQGADCIVVSVDYRLAPETPHPGPVEDCYTALKWLHDHASDLGVDPARIAVSGDSAGGGLAAALALLARDRGEVKLIFQHLIYPMIDDRTCVQEPHPFTGEFVWTPESNRFGWASLLGKEPGSDGVSPYAAAARAENLSGLPPTYIEVGALDLFIEEDMEYARRLIRAGVPTELHVYPGAYHGFGLAADAQVSRQARQNALNALRRGLHGR